MEPHCPSQDPSQAEALRELERLAPDAPFLALGQTVFWDEPMKAGLALALRRHGTGRRFLAGVHDTDYFAKAGVASSRDGRPFKALPHNDTSTKGLWSAAGEFSALFGSETVVTKDRLAAAGVKVTRIDAARPGLLDELTEAWGWRGVVSARPEPRVTAEKPFDPLFPTLFETLDWAVTTTLSLVAGPATARAGAAAEAFLAVACDAADEARGGTLGDYFEALAPKVYDWVAGEPLGLETTRTSSLLKLTAETASLPRFALLGAFLDPKTGETARRAYDEAVAGSEIYPLARFGPGALPFDVFVPGHGRGTLRLGRRGGLVMTPKPLGFSFKKAPTSPTELATLLERRFGPGCAVVGKAVTLIGMLAAEHVFVFHTGASSYVTRSRALHQNLRRAGLNLNFNPILRINYEPWEHVSECDVWFRLPEPLRRPFGADEVSSLSLGRRWRRVAEEQQAVLARLAGLRRPTELVAFLDSALGGRWSCLADQFAEAHGVFGDLNARVAAIKAEKAVLSAKLKVVKADLDAAERAKGRHWRERIFDSDPTPEDLAERRRLSDRTAALAAEARNVRAAWRELDQEQSRLVSSEEVQQARELRASLALEAELMRARLVREAVLASDGLTKSGHRPSAWWFRVVCPDGGWWRKTVEAATYTVEPLV
jgi:hypothetical protein